MTKYFTIFLFYLLNSCSNSANNQYIPERYELIVDEIQHKVAKKLSKEFHMTPVGEGGSFYDCVRELFLAFDIRGPLTKAQLRNILVSSVEEYLSAVNNNEELRPYLIVYPFTLHEIEITLCVSGKWGSAICDPDIGVASVRKGKLVYRTTDRNDTFKHKSKATESYEDALKIVRPVKENHE